MLTWADEIRWRALKQRRYGNEMVRISLWIDKQHTRRTPFRNGIIERFFDDDHELRIAWYDGSPDMWEGPFTTIAEVQTIDPL